MSRIGKQPINVPAGINVAIDNGVLACNGKNGEFKFKIPEGVKAELQDGKLSFTLYGTGKLARSMWGTCRSIVAKAVSGLANDFVKKVNLVGVGYKANTQGNKLVMQLGYSHDIVIDIPSDLKINCESPTVVAVSGASSQRVGEIVKNLQRYRPPEPYKGKGVIIDGQYVYRKEGKKK
jgi:large subunit ribosomal protein L6